MRALLLAPLLALVLPLGNADAEPKPEASDPAASEKPKARTPLPARPRFRISAAGVATAFPHKGVLLLGFHYRHTYHQSPKLILDGAYVEAGARLGLSILIMGGLFVEWMPVRILILRAEYQAWGWLGVANDLGHGLIFQNKDDPFDNATFERRRGEQVAGGGHRFLFKATLRVKLWRIIVVNQTELAGWYLHGTRGTYWYEPIYDTLIRRGETDGVFRNVSFLLFEVWDGPGPATVLLGAQYEAVHTLSANFTRHRLGAVVALRPWPRWGKYIELPTLALLAGTGITDRHREWGFWFATRLSMDFAIIR